MKKLPHALLGTLALASMTLASQAAQAEESISVWMTKGFYRAEDEALLAVADRFYKKSGIKVELSLFSTEDVVTKTVGAVSAGTPPDFAYGTSFNFATTGKWAYDGKLEDVSDVMIPLKDKFLPNTVETTYLYNDKAKKKAYYAAPIAQEIVHTFYWRDMLKDAGYRDADIPKDWKGYWGFWCDKVQPALRAKGQRVYGIGQPTSVQANDTYYEFMSYINAYNVKLVDENGKLLLDDPKNRKNLELALADYVSVYQKGCTPPSSINWTAVDNNVNLHNRTTVMTPNSTLSIPGSYYDAMNSATATPEQKEIARKKYHETLVTARLPNKPDGTPLPSATAVKTAVIFADAKNKEGGKKFMAFLMQDMNLTPYLEGALGRYYPVTKSGAERPFWTDPSDPHRSAAHKMFTEGTIPYQFTYNWKFTTVNAENVWAQAMARIAKDNISPAQATDEMVARIKTIFAN
ncbi:ABC transporter substrate-binding protein [Polaromonas hydrogenivorans]|uniref:ABC transporter substrate-binding protein n=1 Tax=Polaromonas hydrogenivorans TaxID=335476 RepID=A0AAU7LXH3_9BURK